MMAIDVRSPAGFAPATALAFGEMDGQATAVSPANPLPVTLTAAASVPAPLAGSAGASATVGPFQPVRDRPIVLTLSGTWSGTVQLLRSVDGGITKFPLTRSDGVAKGLFQTAINAPVAEEPISGASYYLAITLSAGTVTYRMEQ